MIGFEEVSFANASSFCIFENGKKIRQRECIYDEKKFREWGKPLPIEVKFENSPKQEVIREEDFHTYEYSITHEGKTFKEDEFWLTKRILEILLEEEFEFSFDTFGYTSILKDEVYIVKKDYEKLQAKWKAEEERNAPFFIKLKKAIKKLF